MGQFLYHFLPGARPELATDPEAWTDDDLRISGAHVAYLRSGADAGTVILAGRSQDGVGPAIVILEAASADAAQRFMEEDPFVASGLFRASLHPFRIAMGRIR